MNEIYKEPLIDIVEGCVKGDRRCQQQVYQKFYGKMLGVCLRYSKNKEEARDILQDGFIKVFLNIRNYGGNGSFEGWIRRIMTNTAIDFYRKNKNNGVEASSEIVESTGELMPENESDEPEYIHINTQEVMAAVQRLSPAYRTVFNLYVIDGFTHKEIGEKLGISEGTSKSNLAKAKINLRKVFKDKLKPADEINLESYK